MKTLTRKDMQKIADKHQGEFSVSTVGSYWKIKLCGITHHSTEPLPVVFAETAAIFGINNKLGAGSTPPASGRVTQ